MKEVCLYSYEIQGVTYYRAEYRSDGENYMYHEALDHDKVIAQFRRWLKGTFS